MSERRNLSLRRSMSMLVGSLALILLCLTACNPSPQTPLPEATATIKPTAVIGNPNLTPPTTQPISTPTLPPAPSPTSTGFHLASTNGPIGLGQPLSNFVGAWGQPIAEMKGMYGWNRNGHQDMLSPVSGIVTDLAVTGLPDNAQAKYQVCEQFVPSDAQYIDKDAGGTYHFSSMSTGPFSLTVTSDGCILMEG